MLTPAQRRRLYLRRRGIVLDGLVVCADDGYVMQTSPRTGRAVLVKAGTAVRWCRAGIREMDLAGYDYRCDRSYFWADLVRRRRGAD
jgi:hypothetical protein